MRISMKSILFTIKVAVLTGLVFGSLSLLFYFGDWSRFLLVSLFGFAVGTIAAPEIDASLFKNGWALQIFGGLFGGVSFSLLVTTDMQMVFAVAILGGLIGWLGPFWIKHIQVP
jgi:hypothetical protein